jgi:hypothetical protein
MVPVLPCSFPCPPEYFITATFAALDAYISVSALDVYISVSALDVLSAYPH